MNQTNTHSSGGLLPASLAGQKHTLRFSSDGQFRVLVFTDVQASPPAPCDRTILAVNTIIDRESPDLILFCGDNAIHCKTDEQLHDFLTVLTAHIEEKKIPWAHVYGNHDDEDALSRSEQQDIYEKFAYCVSRRGPEHIKGVGNYVLPVYPSDESRTDPLFAVWGLDSGSYVDDAGLAGYSARLGHTMFRGQPESNYAYMPFTQIRWYYNTSEEIEQFAGHRVPGMAYFHTPLQEFYEIALNPEETEMTGEKREEVCAGPLNSGMFAAMVERGDIKAVCCGHDHCNDYAGTFCGICLAYAANIGYDTYHHEDMMGGRMFIIREDAPEQIETYMSYICR